MPTVFYSWQSDTPGSFNRNLIERALKAAIKQLNLDIAFAEAERESLVLDKDTQGIAGSPPIAATILAKIRQCDVFIADVTMSYRNLDNGSEDARTKYSPNPNVMYELGYASGQLEDTRIICVCNTAYGPGNPEALPFDIRFKRNTLYHCNDESPSKSAIQKNLEQAFYQHLKAMLPSLSAKQTPAESSVEEQLETYLADPQAFIKLDQLVNRTLGDAAARICGKAYPQRPSQSEAEFGAVLQEYEEALQDVLKMTIRLTQWQPLTQYRQTMEHMFSRLAEEMELLSGSVLWLRMRWYPFLLLLYAGGLTALYRRDYDKLYCLMSVPVRRKPGEAAQGPVLQETISALRWVDSRDCFKRLPGYEGHFAARSDYLFDRLQPMFQAQLQLGARYETLFDHFEIMAAWCFADFTMGDTHIPSPWAPTGRYKYAFWDDDEQNAYTSLWRQAEVHGREWPPLKAGFFRGSLERLLHIAARHGAHMERFNPL